MYESHYGFDAKPFSIVPNPKIIFLNENYQNALSYMKYGLKEKVGFILLTGEIGAGKTTLIRYMLNAIKDQMDFAVIFNTHFSSDQLFRLILSEFEIPSESHEKERHLELLYEFLIERYAKGRHVLLIIDEAQNLPDDALEDIRMLSNLQTNEQNLLQVMLVGQPELKKRLASPAFRQLAQRIAVSYHLPPLAEDQTYRYVTYRLEAVGGKPDIFTPAAVKLIHDKSGGIPRTINLLCDAALVYGFADDLQHIDHDTVELVLADQICILDPSCQAKHAGPPPKLAPSAETDDLRSRLSAVERTVSNLQYRIEDLSREMKNDLFFKYQDLLISERSRHDQLKNEYNKLFQDHTRLAAKLEGITQTAANSPEMDPLPQSATEIGDHDNDRRPVMQWIREWWGKGHHRRVTPAKDGGGVSRLASITSMLGQRIVNFNLMEKLSRLWARMTSGCSTFFANAIKKCKPLGMPRIKMPSATRWVDGINRESRMNRPWLPWSVACLILISFTSLFLVARTPMTASVPDTKQFQFENPVDADPGPSSESDNIAAVIPAPEIDPEPEKSLNIAFDANREEQSPLHHVVQAGDTLSSIAREYKTDVDAIVSENKLQNHVIYVGQILKIPPLGKAGGDRDAG